MTIGEIKAVNKEIQRLGVKLVRLESEAYGASPVLDGSPSGDVSDRVGNLASQITDIKVEIQTLLSKRDMALNLLSRAKFEENCMLKPKQKKCIELMVKGDKGRLVSPALQGQHLHLFRRNYDYPADDRRRNDGNGAPREA